MRNFLANHKLAVVEAAGAAAQTALDSNILDMTDFQTVTFLALLGDVSSGSVLTLTLQHGDESNGSDMESTTIVANFTAGAADADSKLLAVEGHNMTKRYARARLTRTTADAVVGGIVSIQSNPKTAPVSQDASVIAHDFGAPVLSA